MTIENIWQDNIDENLLIVEKNNGPALFISVAGSEKDKSYWHRHFEELKGTLFCKDRTTKIVSIAEKRKKGNFLGTLNAWLETKGQLRKETISFPDVVLMNMIFGQGKRLSPFTQALGNRKSALPLPFNISNVDALFCTADLSCLYSNLWVNYLRNQGFRGVLIKWGDEAVIPGKRLALNSNKSLSDISGIRFVSYRSLTPDLAREKEWLLVANSNELVKKQFARGNYEFLNETFSTFKEDDYQIGVNLGSLAISYDFLDIAANIFYDDLSDASKWVDWDPYIWIALHCDTEEQWIETLNDERNKGFGNLSVLVNRYPDLYKKVYQLKNEYQEKIKNHFKIQAIDFGQPYWADFGLHHSLQDQFESLLQNSNNGLVSRKLFRIPESVDENGNRIIRSEIPKNAKIYNSIVIDSVITSPDTYINKGLIVGGMHNLVSMPDGGSAMYCVVENLRFHGSRGVALFAVGRNISVSMGGRYTTLLTPSRYRHLIGNESILDYNESIYNDLLFGNEISFADAEKIVAEIDSREIYSIRDGVVSKGWDVLDRI